MQINTRSNSQSGAYSTSFPAKVNSVYGTHLDPEGVMELTVSQVVGAVTFSIDGDIEETEHDAKSITIRPTADNSLGVIIVHTEGGIVVVDVTLGGDTIVGLTLDSL